MHSFWVSLAIIIIIIIIFFKEGPLIFLLWYTWLKFNTVNNYNMLVFIPFHNSQVNCFYTTGSLFHVSHNRNYNILQHAHNQRPPEYILGNNNEHIINILDLLWFLVPDLPPISTVTPHPPVDLKVELVTVGGRYALNISWAICLDGRWWLLENLFMLLTSGSLTRTWCSFLWRGTISVTHYKVQNVRILSLKMSKICLNLSTECEEVTFLMLWQRCMYTCGPENLFLPAAKKSCAWSLNTNTPLVVWLPAWLTELTG